MKETNLAKKIFVSNFFSLKKPYKLTFAITYGCNSRCRICRIWEKNLRREMSIEEIGLFFRRNNYFNWIDLTGGEVFLRPDLPDICRTIIQSCENLYLLHMPTNGLLPEIIEKNVVNILKFHPSKFIISISVDGPADLHERLRGIKGSWLKAVETYKRLKKIKKQRIEVYFGMTLSGYNYGLIEETYQDLKKEITSLKRDDLHFNIAHNSLSYYSNSKIELGVTKDIDLKLKEFNKKKVKKYSVVAILESKYQELILKYLKLKKSPLRCLALNASIFIDPVGNVFPCSIWNKKIANLKDDGYDLEKIVLSNKATKLKEIIKLNQCAGCWTPCEAYQTILGNILHL